MSFATARRDMEKRLRDNWATTRISYENVAFKHHGQSHVTMRIFEDSTQRINIGNPGYHRVSGLIIFEIRVPLNTGTQIARNYADTIAEIFRDRQFNGITCREAVPNNIGQEDGWYRFNLSVRFQWDGRYSV